LRFIKKLVNVEDIDNTYEGKEVIVRGRLHNSRGKGKLCFIVLR
jgi:aspartyl/asparaginyl-tRNA synthetase